MSHTNSLKSRIVNFLYQWKEYDPKMFVNGGEIERLALQCGYKGSTASRILRKLAEEGKPERRINKGAGTHSVEYRYI